MSDAPKQQAVDPNAPWSPEELQEEISAEDIEALKKELPVLDEVITWFDQQIAEFLNPNVIQAVKAKDNATDVKEAVMFAQKMSKGYSKKRNEFAVRFKKYIAQVTPPPPPAE